MIIIDDRKQLLSIAANAIRQRLRLDESNPPGSAELSTCLRSNGASFVTLTYEDHLRGCIGTLEAHRPLMEDVRENAIAAAFRDPRFEPVSVDEFTHLTIDISVLSAHTPITFTDEDELIVQLRPGIDGLVIRQGLARATFLPSVWKTLSDPTEFLRHLKAKAGIHSADRLEAWRYTSESFSSEEIA
jgi:AmmeMemoRadiSam system protein A